jgi:hypothetical protein
MNKGIYCTWWRHPSGIDPGRQGTVFFRTRAAGKVSIPGLTRESKRTR